MHGMVGSLCDRSDQIPLEASAALQPKDADAWKIVGDTSVEWRRPCATDPCAL
jgi:hypothetical protein